jgi:hypothetical protein
VERRMLWTDKILTDRGGVWRVAAWGRVTPRTRVGLGGKRGFRRRKYEREDVSHM